MAAALGFVVAFTAFSLASASCNGPYTLTYTPLSGTDTDYEFHCSGAFGQEIANASFYHNAVEIRDSNDPCSNIVSTLPDKGKITLRLVSECDGYYTCGSGEVFSEPLPVSTSPREIGPGKPDPIHLEEGDTVTLPCYVSTSPVIKQQVSWHRIHDDGVTQDLEDHNKSESSYVIMNATVDNNNGKYYCIVRSPDTVFDEVISVNDGEIPVIVHPKFVVQTIAPPRFNRISPLAYSIINDEAGTAQFEALFEHNSIYPINTYQWRINGSSMNSTNSSKVRIDNFKYGRTMVEVIATNKKYDKTEHSSSQIIYVDRQLLSTAFTAPPSCNPGTPEPEINSSTNDTMLYGLIPLAIFSSVLLVISLILVIMLLVQCRRNQPNQKLNEGANNHLQSMPLVASDSNAGSAGRGMASAQISHPSNSETTDDFCHRQDPLMKVFQKVMDLASIHVKDPCNYNTNITVLRYIDYFITTVCESDVTLSPEVREHLIEIYEDVHTTLAPLLKEKKTSTPHAVNVIVGDVGKVAFDSGGSDVSKGANNDQQQRNGGNVISKSNSLESKLDEDNKEKEMMENILEKVTEKLQQIKV